MSDELYPHRQPMPEEEKKPNIVYVWIIFGLLMLVAGALLGYSAKILPIDNAIVTKCNTFIEQHCLCYENKPNTQYGGYYDNSTWNNISIS